MKLNIFFAGLLSLALCTPSFSQEISRERANELATQIYASKDVAKLVAAAKAMRRMDAAQDDKNLSATVDRSVHPKPYGSADENFCQVEMRAAYGWYADPVLVITVKAFVAKSKLEAGKLTEKDFTIRDFNATIPDPTGLE